MECTQDRGRVNMIHINTPSMITYVAITTPVLVPVRLQVKYCASAPNRVMLITCEAGPGVSASLTEKANTTAPTAFPFSMLAVYAVWFSIGLKKLFG